jgi:hypothetical protein
MQESNQSPHFALRFRPTVKEYRALLYATKYTWTERLYAFIVPAAYWGLALILSVPILVYAPVRRFLIEHIGYYAPPAVAVVFGLLFYCFHSFILFPRLIRDALEGQIISQGENEITVDENGVVSRIGTVYSNIPWSGVRRVADVRGCILLFTGRNSGLILPRRAFASPQEADRMLALAHQKTGAAQ